MGDKVKARGGEGRLGENKTGGGGGGGEIR